MTKKSDLCGDFGADLLFEGVVAVPRLLLHNYARLGLQEGEVILILQLISLRERNSYPSTGELAALMGVNPERIENIIGRLIEESFLSVAQVYAPQTGQVGFAYSLTGLMEKLSEIWAQDKAKCIEERKKALKEKTPVISKLNAGTRNLVKAFEQEFGRPLTEIECSNIIEWNEGCGFPQELIFEALKRAVLNQTPNWRYINSILREWDKKNLKTLQDVFEDDARFKARQSQLKGGARTKSSAGKSPLAKEKYKDFYL